MLSIVDCIALCELTEDEVTAIAEHEDVPEIVAAELGRYLLHSPGRIPKIKAFFKDDIEEARRAGDFLRVYRLRKALCHFLEHHPEAQAN
jgi:hypothetical protein